MIKNVKFIRYGGLSPYKQEHYETDPEKKGFHNPPVRYGFYAMIQGYEEPFLLGATNSPNHISGKTQWLKDENEHLVEDTRRYDDKTDRMFCTKEVKVILKKNKISEKQLSSKQLKKKPDCPIDKNGEELDDCDICPLKKECDIIKESPHYLVVLKKPRIFEYYGEIWHHLESKPGEILEKSGSWVKTTYQNFIIAFNRDLHNTLRDSHQTEKEYNNLDLKNRTINNPYKRSNGLSYVRDHLEVFIEKL